jgi:hypothetical protein
MSQPGQGMTFAAIAAELGLDERTVRREFESVLAKLRALDPDLDPEHFFEEITAHYKIPRRFSPIAVESDRAPRASPPNENRPSPPAPVDGGERAGHLPRRFTRRKP